MTIAPGHFVLFPHMAIREGDLRCHSIFLPHLSVVEAVAPARIPPWAAPRTTTLPSASLGQGLELARQCLAGYRGLGELHGASGMLSAIVRDWAGDPAESRLGIQHFLRDRPGGQQDPRELLLIEAAVFLEMARLLDEEEIELDRSILRARALEAEFREIVGAAEEEETREELETLTVSLDIDRSHLSYMLRERIGHWLRLFGTSAVEAPTALVAGNPQVTHEMLEASIPRGSNPASFRPAARQIRLASIPDPGNLTPEAFETLLAGLGQSGILESTWTTLGLYLKDPAAAVLEEVLQDKITALQAEFASLAAAEDFADGDTSMELWLTVFTDLTWGDLWRFFDKKGFDVLGKQAALPMDAPVPPLLHVSPAEEES